jgi:predicted membrane-bound spermidine synthase
MGVKPAKYKLEFVNFVVGAAVLTFELTASRVAAPYIGTSIYIWTSIIGVILAALALGYWLGGKLADKRRREEDIALLLCLSAGLILIINSIKDPLLGVITNNALPLQWQALIASILLFSVPTVVLGMVSPYLARLNITKLVDSGQKLASISAWGTVGSLFGTFLTGYILFGFVGARHLLTGIALTLLLVSFVMSIRKYLLTRMVLAGVIILQLIWSPALVFGNVVADLDTRYNRVTVRDVKYGTRPVRVLQMDREYWQSGVYLDNAKSLVFPYTQAFYSLAQSNPAAKRQLIIGGGAFTFPEFLALSMPESQVDVVEIDGELVEISNKYFNFKQPSNLEIIIADGRQYLNTVSKNYDFIYLDAFSSVEPPFQLFTIEAAKLAKSSLTAEGSVIINVIASVEGDRAQMLNSVVTTFAKVFKSVDVYRVNAELRYDQAQNLVVVAGDGSVESTLSALRLPFSHINPGQVLSDDFAPVERMTSRGI